MKLAVVQLLFVKLVVHRIAVVPMLLCSADCSRLNEVVVVVVEIQCSGSLVVGCQVG